MIQNSIFFNKCFKKRTVYVGVAFFFVRRCILARTARRWIIKSDIPLKSSENHLTEFSNKYVPFWLNLFSFQTKAFLENRHFKRPFEQNIWRTPSDRDCV